MSAARRARSASLKERGRVNRAVVVAVGGAGVPGDLGARATDAVWVRSAPLLRCFGCQLASGTRVPHQGFLSW
jgi:hypothetical protein